MVNQFMFVTCSNCISVTLKPVKRYLYIKQATASIVFVVSCHSSPEKIFPKPSVLYKVMGTSNKLVRYLDSCLSDDSPLCPSAVSGWSRHCL